jgi:hypothetical protein
MIGDVSQRMANQFATCLAERMAALETQPAAGVVTEPGGAPTPTPAPLPRAAAPVGGIRLALWALFRAIGRGLSRLGRAIARLFKRG